MSERLRVTGVVKQYPGPTRALDGVSLDVDGGLTAIIGPSGCGKTTLLKVIAGLEQVDDGRVFVGDRDVTALPAARRSTAMVFQADTLFPDLSVRDNVAFGLRSRGRVTQASAEAVEVALLRFGLVGVQERYPNQLSGGQQRRAALARALVLAPDVLLLDEPLSGLDGTLSTQLAATIRDTQRRFGLTTLLVTHDQDEALSLADRVVVMRAGRVEQLGTPQDVYARPASLFVAGFVGRANLLEVEVIDLVDGAGLVRACGLESLVPAHSDVTGSRCVLMVRPHAVRLYPHETATAWTEVSGAVGLVTDVLYYGSRLDYIVETEHGMVTVARRPDDEPFALGAGVRVVLDAEEGWLLPIR